MKILAAVDGSDHSTRALEFAARLAESFRAELAIVTVSQRVVDEEVRRFGKIEHATVDDIVEQEAAALLLVAKTRAEALGAARISTAAEEGDPAAVLLDYARAADALVIGRRGRGRLAGLLLGSVSQKLAALSPVPVTIVP
jgi:nucleotide-binding universal stress UspA family protein